MLLALLFSLTLSQTPTSTFQGTVTDPSGVPIQGALVRLLDGAEERSRAETDQTGHFAIAANCASCTLDISRAGFETAVVTPTNGSLVLVRLPIAAVRESIVVTATGRETAESSVGASISVVTPEDIEQRHAISTVDLLRAVPGVIASRPGGHGNLTSVWIRGGESTYNKVLLDGIPLNEPGGAFNFASLAPENIERIEVLRGAHSALFGSDAMASVVQIFSSKSDSARPQVTFTADAGSYDTTHVAASLGARRNRLDYQLFGSHLDTDNREANNEHRMTTLSGSFSNRTTGGANMRILARGDFGRTGVPGTTAFGRADMDALSEHGNSSVLAVWDQPIGTRITQRASYSLARSRQESVNLAVDPPYTPQYGDRRASFEFQDFLYHSTSDLRRHHAEYRADVVLRPGHTVTAAFAYDGERAELTNHLSNAAPQNPKRDNTGTTFQYENLAGRVSTIAGIRFENNGSFGFYAAPRAAVSWLVSAPTRVHASAGLGIKEPTFLQSYSTNPGFLGNPNLDPERSRSIDAGIEQRLVRNRVKLDVTYFANSFDDLISLRTIDPATFSSQYFNIGRTTARGVELLVDAEIRGGVRVGGHYTLLDSKVVRSTSSSPIFAPGRPLFRRPRHSGAIHASFGSTRTNLSMGAVFVGRRVDSDSASLGLTSNTGYAVVNGTITVGLGRRSSVFVTADNLGDYQYMDPLGYRALARTLRAGITASF